MKWSRLMAFLSVLSLSGCSSLVQKSPYVADEQVLDRALSGQLILGQSVTQEQLPDVDLFALTPAMKSFAEQAVGKRKSPDAKAEAIHYALLESTAAGGRGISYSADLTTTGAEAFEQRQANCLSYTLLYVAMARHVGLKAEVNEVMLPPTWNMSRANSYLFMRHINAKVMMPKSLISFSLLRQGRVIDVGDIVVDLELRRFRNRYKQELIDEDHTAAQFYNNRGMELSTLGDQRGAFLHLRKSLEMVDDASYIWGNLGTFYRRQGFLVEAEAVYLHGLSINPNDFTIMHNLSALYVDMGNPLRHEEFKKRVRAHRNANPYFMYKRAEDFADAGDYNKARSLIEKAIDKEELEPRFYRVAAEVYEKMGDHKKASKARKKFEDLLEKSRIRAI